MFTLGKACEWGLTVTSHITLIVFKETLPSKNSEYVLYLLVVDAMFKPSSSRKIKHGTIAQW